LKQRSPDKYRDVAESILPDEAKKYAPLILGNVKAHLGSLSRDENCYHTIIGANALLKAWQKWQEKKEQYTEAQFLVLAKAYVHGYLQNDGDRDVASQKSAWQSSAALQQYEREEKEDEEREIREAQAKAARKEPVASAPEQPREDPYFSVFHYRVQLLPTREQAFMQWLHYAGSIAAASKEMNLTRQAGNDIKRSADKILEEYAARLENGETYSQLRQGVEAKRKPGRYDVFLQRVTAKINRQGTAYQAAPIVNAEGEEYGYDLGDEEGNHDYRHDDWQYDLMVNEACYREDILGQSRHDERHG
jgi:hypothetical protein